MRAFSFAFLLAFVLSLSSPLARASGQLDTRFDGDGKRVLAIGTDTGVSIRDGLLDRGGRHVAVGHLEGDGFVAGLVMRLLPDGRPDPAFASNGVLLMASPDFARDSFSLARVTEQSDGKLLIVGTTADLASRRGWACRLLPGGGIDPAYGNVGCQELQFWFDSPSEQVLDLAMQSGDRPVIVGLTFFDGNPGEDYALLRLDTNGMPDRCFGDPACLVGGVLLQPGKPEDALVSIGMSINTAPDDRILLAGGANTDMLAIRLLSDGAVDTDFGKDGHVLVPFDAGGANADQAFSVAALPDGGTVLVGSATTADGKLVAIARLDATGDTVSGFDGDGRLVTFFNDVAPDQSAFAVEVQDDGKLLVAGTATLFGGQSDCGLLRVMPDGTLDPVFGLDGRVSLDGGATNESPRPDSCRTDIGVRNGAIALFGTRDTAPNDADALFLRFEQDGILRDGFESD